MTAMVILDQPIQFDLLIVDQNNLNVSVDLSNKPFNLDFRGNVPIGIDTDDHWDVTDDNGVSIKSTVSTLNFNAPVLGLGLSAMPDTTVIHVNVRLKYNAAA